MVAAGAAITVAEKVKAAAQRPIYSRSTVEVWDADNEEWVPASREKSIEITPAALVALPVAAVAASVALHVSGLQIEPVTESVQTQVPNPAYEQWKKDNSALDRLDPRIRRFETAERANYVEPPPKTLPGPVVEMRKFKLTKRPRFIVDFHSGLGGPLVGPGSPGDSIKLPNLVGPDGQPLTPTSLDPAQTIPFAASPLLYVLAKLFGPR